MRVGSARICATRRRNTSSAVTCSRPARASRRGPQSLPQPYHSLSGVRPSHAPNPPHTPPGSPPACRWHPAGIPGRTAAPAGKSRQTQTSRVLYLFSRLFADCRRSRKPVQTCHLRPQALARRGAGRQGGAGPAARSPKRSLTHLCRLPPAHGTGNDLRSVVNGETGGRTRGVHPCGSPAGAWRLQPNPVPGERPSETSQLAQAFCREVQREGAVPVGCHDLLAPAGCRVGKAGGADLRRHLADQNHRPGRQDVGGFP